MSQLVSVPVCRKSAKVGIQIFRGETGSFLHLKTPYTQALVKLHSFVWKTPINRPNKFNYEENSNLDLSQEQVSFLIVIQ